MPSPPKIFKLRHYPAFVMVDKTHVGLREWYPEDKDKKRGRPPKGKRKQIVEKVPKKKVTKPKNVEAESGKEKQGQEEKTPE